MTKPELPAWLQADFDLLADQYLAGSMAHAVLLAGPAGIGKSLLLEQLTRVLVCSENKPSPCGVCRGCILLAAGNYPDLIRLEPEENKQQISVDQVRGLLERIYKTPQIGSGKVIQILPAEAMNRNAANALLKCLEEPPDNTYFLLLSSAAARLPATVRSRCRLQRLAGADPAQALEWLQRQGVDEAERQLAICPSQPLLALREGAEMLELDAAVQRALLTHLSEPLAVVNTAKQLQQKQAIKLAAAWLRVVRELLKVRLGLPGAGLHAELKDLALNNKWSIAGLQRHASRVQSNLYSLRAGSHLNEQLLTEDWLSNFAASLAHAAQD